eukprot:1160623-Pelagomonas_calceolata.AAC.14
MDLIASARHHQRTSARIGWFAHFTGICMRHVCACVPALVPRICSDLRLLCALQAAYTVRTFLARLQTV